MKIRILKAFAGYRVGVELTIEDDGNGVPLDKFWRRRVADSRADACLEVLVEEKPKKKAKDKAEAEAPEAEPVSVENVEAE